MDADQDPGADLASLVGAFRIHLGWLRDHGVRSAPAGPSPRSGPDPSVSEEVPAADAPPLAAALVPEPEGEVGPPDRGALLESVRADLGDCRRCRLCEGRTHLVFGVGHPAAEILFIGEAPGRDEDLQGEPFVGAAGQLLTKMIGAMGLERDEVYIANVTKCRPPENRDPTPEEVDTCEPFLRRQIEAIKPRIIIALGNFAAKTLLRTDQGITRLRGRFHTYQGIPLMPTFHPAALLRNPDYKRPVWDDLKAVMAEMDRLGLKRRRTR
jgi:DNA polymerase